MAPFDRGHFSLRCDKFPTVNRNGRPTAAEAGGKRTRCELAAHTGKASGPVYQMLLPKKPNRGCCATKIVGGP
jgi:hypothetical protein